MLVYLNRNSHLWGGTHIASVGRRLEGRHAAAAMAGRHAAAVAATAGTHAAATTAGTHGAAATAATRHACGGVFKQAHEGQGNASEILLIDGYLNVDCCLRFMPSFIPIIAIKLLPWIMDCTSGLLKGLGMIMRVSNLVAMRRC